MFYGLDLTYSNGAKYTDTNSDTDGYAENYIMLAPKVTGTLRIRRDAYADAALTNWTTPTVTTLIVAWQGAATFGETSGDLSITIPMGIDRVETDRTNEELLVITFTGKKTDSYDCLTVKLADGVDKGW